MGNSESVSNDTYVIKKKVIKKQVQQQQQFEVKQQVQEYPPFQQKENKQQQPKQQQQLPQKYKQKQEIKNNSNVREPSKKFSNESSPIHYYENNMNDSLTQRNFSISNSVSKNAPDQNQSSMLRRENIIMDYPQTSKMDIKDGQSLVPQQSVEFNPYNFNESLEKIELEMEKEVDEFEQEQERRRIQFEKNRKHKKEYLESQINKFESQYNPWELLGLHQDDYSIPNIKKAYKKNALKYHPDRAGKKYEDRFQLITQAYIYLLNKAEESDHLEQKMSRPVEKIDYENDANEQVENIYVDKDNFDLNKFNKIFDKYKIPDSFDDGYADLMKKDFDKNSQNQIENNDNKIFGKKFNNDIFNSHFDNLKTKKSNEIIEYMDPLALEASSNVSRGLLGVSKVEDYGTVNSGNLSYTDYKKAHFEENLLIDVNKVKYTNHKSIDDLEQERSRLSYVATPQDKKRYDLLEQRRLEEDRQRDMQQKQYDTMIQNQYHKLNKKLIVHK